MNFCLLICLALFCSFFCVNNNLSLIHVKLVLMTCCNIFLVNYRVRNSGGGPVDISLEEDHNDYVGLKHQLEDVENRVCTVRKKNFIPEEIGTTCSVHVTEVKTGKFKLINAVKRSYKFFCLFSWKYTDPW